MSGRQHNYRAYIVASVSRVIYVGVTNDLERRVWEHKTKAVEGFTKKYNCTKLVWFEEFREVRDAIACEKRIKGWLRAKKMAMIEERNPYWRDLSDGWYKDVPSEAGKPEMLRFAQNDKTCGCHAERSEASLLLSALRKNDRDSSLRSE